jgi:long-chain acyl-CoA synthetase
MQNGDAGEGASGPAVRSGATAWVFDLDGCLIDSLTGTSLRPGAMELLEHLGRCNRVVLWSAGGADYARDRAEQFDVDLHVSAYFSKDGRDDNGNYCTGHLTLDAGRAVFVDDRPEDLAIDLDVLAVSPYLAPDPHDRGLVSVARHAGLHPAFPETVAKEE